MRAVDNARHTLAECPAMDAARNSLQLKLPWYLKNFRAPFVQNALMGGTDLELVCGPETAVRRAVVEAAKAFWRRARCAREDGRDDYCRLEAR